MTTATSLVGTVPLPEALKSSGLPVSMSTACRWCRLGMVPATRIGGRWYARPDALLAAAVREVGTQP